MTELNYKNSHYALVLVVLLARVKLHYWKCYVRNFEIKYQIAVVTNDIYTKEDAKDINTSRGVVY